MAVALGEKTEAVWELILITYWIQQFCTFLVKRTIKAGYSLGISWFTSPYWTDRAVLQLVSNALRWWKKMLSSRLHNWIWLTNKVTSSFMYNLSMDCLRSSVALLTPIFCFKILVSYMNKNITSNRTLPWNWFMTESDPFWKKCDDRQNTKTTLLFDRTRPVQNSPSHLQL